MQKLKSILLATIIMVVSVCACITTAYAAPDTPLLEKSGTSITPYYTYANTVRSDLSITETTAKATVSLTGASNTKSISVTYTLQKKSGTSWTSVKSWTASSVGRTLSSQNTYSPLTKGTQYRVYATFTVTGTDGGKETITDYSGTYTC